MSGDSDDEDVESRRGIHGPLLFGVLYSLLASIPLLLGVCVGGFVGMVVLGCGKLVLGVRAAKTTIEKV